MRVRVNSKYCFVPVMIDRNIPINSGSIVTVVNLHGCPKANTMNHCYVKYGDSISLVHCNSLCSLHESWVIYSVVNDVCKIVTIVQCKKPNLTKAWKTLLYDVSAIRPRTIGYCRNEKFQDVLNFNNWTYEK